MGPRRIRWGRGPPAINHGEDVAVVDGFVTPTGKVMGPTLFLAREKVKAAANQLELVAFGIPLGPTALVERSPPCSHWQPHPISSRDSSEVNQDVLYNSIYNDT